MLATLLAASSCFGPLYDDVDPLAGQLGVCCNTDTSSLGEHLTVPGERATAQFFPACSCFEGPACPIHKPLGGGKCYGLTGGSGGEDAGVAFPTFDSGVAYPVDSGLQPNDAGFQPLDAGSLPPNPDAGSQSDAGAPTDAGGVDAGIGTRDAGVFTDAGVSPTGPQNWSVCCIDSRLTTCSCPAVGPCANAEFSLCGSLTCTHQSTCPRYP